MYGLMADSYYMEEQESGWQAAVRRFLPLVLVILLVGALGTLLYSASTATRDHERALTDQRRSFEIIALARAFEAKTARAEVTLARYVISLDPDVGRLFQDQWRTASSQLKLLTYATRRSGWQRANVQELRQAFEERGKTLIPPGGQIGRAETYHQAARPGDPGRKRATSGTQPRREARGESHTMG
jgi:hypothetical protein